MLKNFSSQEPLGQFQPNLARNMLVGWAFRFVQIKGLVPFGPNKGQNKKLLISLLMNHQPECIDI